jgi:hypothetical protein
MLGSWVHGVRDGDEGFIGFLCSGCIGYHIVTVPGTRALPGRPCMHNTLLLSTVWLDRCPHPLSLLLHLLRCAVFC